ncbi:MAG: hypothetical protein ACLUUO_06135 [Sellimonas intestinalis]
MLPLYVVSGSRYEKFSFLGIPMQDSYDTIKKISKRNWSEKHYRK